MENSRFISLSPGEGRYVVEATGQPDLTCFSPFELREMKRLVETHARRFVKMLDAGEAIQAGFQNRAWGIKPNAGIDYVYDIIIKQKEAITMPGLHALIEKYTAKMREFETDIADVKHKLEIVREASRLLAEEGVSDERPPDHCSGDRAYQKRK